MSTLYKWKPHLFKESCTSLSPGLGLGPSNHTTTQLANRIIHPSHVNESRFRNVMFIHPWSHRSHPGPGRVGSGWMRTPPHSAYSRRSPVHLSRPLTTERDGSSGERHAIMIGPLGSQTCGRVLGLETWPRCRWNVGQRDGCVKGDRGDVRGANIHPPCVLVLASHSPWPFKRSCASLLHGQSLWFTLKSLDLSLWIWILKIKGKEINMVHAFSQKCVFVMFLWGLSINNSLSLNIIRGECIYIYIYI